MLRGHVPTTHGLPATMNVAHSGWVLFSIVVTLALALDLFVFNRRGHVVRLAEALWTSAFWIVLAVLFGIGVTMTGGHKAGLEFFTGYVIELSLSVDNLFVFLLLFGFFTVPAEQRHRVLFWGILGAVVFRLGFILAGVALLARFHWVLYLFGGVLVYSGVRMLRPHEAEVHPERNPILRLLRRFVPITPDYRAGAFFVRDPGLYATPLLVVLVMVETTDLVFAVDSIPAVLAVTRDPFIVFTSNVFAILGLRALFFSLARVLELFHFLHYGLALILVFVGLKMLASHWIEVPIALTLGMVLTTLVVCVVLSILHPRRVSEPPAPPAG